MIFQQRDYRGIMRDELDTRREQNPAYSLRAFARDLKLSSSRLSEVLSGRHHLSLASATKVAERMTLSTLERQYFLSLVRSQIAKTQTTRQKALKQLELCRKEAKGEHESYSVVVAIELNQLQLARRLIRNFLKDFCAQLGHTSKHDRVYSLAVQFFGLSDRSRP